MRRQIGVATLFACAVFTLSVAAAGRWDQHGAQGRDAIDKLRDRDLQPDRIMDVIGLRPGMTVGEAGASYGYFTFKMSRRVGPTGVVYANDIAPDALKTIDTRAASAKIGNIKTVLGEEADPRFPRNDLDMIVVFDCLFEFSQPDLWMKNAREYLKPGGRLVVVDPDPSKMASEHFLSRQQVHDFARTSGYTVLGVDDAFLKTHMIVVLRPLPRGSLAAHFGDLGRGGGASHVPVAPAAQWTPMRSGTAEGLVGVWGASPRDVFVVGTKGTILHFDGNAWAAMPVEGAPALIAVWGASGHDVFAVGDDGVILHYDGRAWTAMESGTKKNLIGVWGASGRDVYVAGYAGTLLHYDGRAWTPMVTNTTDDLYAVWGTGPNGILAVGGTPMPIPGKGTVLRYDGRAWSPMPIGTSAFLAGVWGSSARDVFAVGVGYTILHYDGQAWTLMPAGIKPADGKVNLLTRVWGSGANDVFAIGFDGVLLHYDGKRWAAVPSGTTQSLNTIWGFSPEDIFVVGGGGTILHYGPK